MYHNTIDLKNQPSRMSVARAANNLITEFQSRPTVRAGSLITTVYGDAIAPRGGSVWIGSLITAMAEFGISERLVRTSVFRLSADGWLESQSVGRRSYYGLTSEGAERFDRATHRIYGEPRQRWSGDWCLVLLGGVSPVHRDELRKELSWLGFGSISSNVMAHPAPDEQELQARLERKEIDGDVVVMTGQSAGARQDQKLRSLAQKSWNLDDINQRYADFLERFRPVFAAVRRTKKPDPQRAFQIRTLLIQEYRKIMLRDPLLPRDLLPNDWSGLAAYQLCRNLYRSIHMAADDYLGDTMETVDGPLPPPVPEFYDRFGGLSRE